jgi:hypothetical protein
MLLDDHVVKSQAMAASPFSKPFEERLVPWERKLRRFQVRATQTAPHTVLSILTFSSSHTAWFVRPIRSQADPAQQLHTACC